MKSFKDLLAEVAEPKSGDEQNFKDKHEIEFWDHPESEESQHSSMKRKAKRRADYDEGEDEEVYESLRFGVERMPEKLVKDLRDYSDYALGYDFSDKGFNVSFDRQIDKAKLAKYLNTKDYMIDFEGKKGKEFIYFISENFSDSVNENFAIYYQGRIWDSGFKTKEEAQDRLNGMNLDHGEKKEYRIRVDKRTSKPGMTAKMMKEASSFITKAAHSKKDGKKKFKMGNQEYPVTIKDKNVDKIIEEKAIVKAIRKSQNINESTATDYPTYGAYVTARTAKNLQVIPEKLWNDLKKKSKHLPESVGNLKSYLIVDNNDKSKGWSILELSISGPNPHYLTDQIKKRGKALGFAYPILVAQWEGKLESELKKAKDQLSSGQKFIPSYETSIKEKIKELEAAKKIMSSTKELKEQIKVVSHSITESFKTGDKVTYQKSKKERGNAVISSASTAKKNHFYIKTEKEGTIMVPAGELELAEAYDLSEKLAWSHNTYDDYVAYNKKKGLQVIPKDLWASLKKNPYQRNEETLSENFKAGLIKLDDASSISIKKQDADLLNQMFKDLNSTNRSKMLKVAMTDKAGFEEILGFAREAL